MPVYKKMYLLLFNAVTDAVKDLEHHCYSDSVLKIINDLKTAQQQCEDIFISDRDLDF